MRAASSLHPVRLTESWTRARPITWPLERTVTSSRSPAASISWFDPVLQLRFQKTSPRKCRAYMEKQNQINSQRLCRKDQTWSAELECLVPTEPCGEPVRPAPWSRSGQIHSRGEPVRSGDACSGEAVSPHPPSHWLQQDARCVSFLLEPQMQLDPPQVRNGAGAGSFTCWCLTLPA